VSPANSLQGVRRGFAAAAVSQELFEPLWAVFIGWGSGLRRSGHRINKSWIMAVIHETSTKVLYRCVFDPLKRHTPPRRRQPGQILVAGMLKGGFRNAWRG
jgi:hypothetical protein